MKYLFLLLLSVLSVNTFAAGISGYVKDAKDNAPLSGVVVSLQSAGKAVQTDSTGFYAINDLADGTYELTFTYITYITQTATATVSAGTSATLDVLLKGEHNQLSGVSINKTRVKNTETAVLNEIRKSNAVVSGISAAQIGKTMDRNAADVVKRIPGVTIQDDRFITVRGLADRYNTVWLNDAGAPSSEADKKAFSFDIIPSGLIDRILVFKTPSPELPGDFAGGMVKIYTTSLPAGKQYTFGIQTSYRQGSTGTDFNYNQRSSTDWLGYDNGMRGLPEGTPKDLKYDDPGNEEITKAFGNGWQVYKKKQPLDLRINASASNIFQLGKVKLGNTFGLTYSSVSTNYNVQRFDWTDASTKDFHYNDLQSVNKNTIGLLNNLVFSLGNTKIEFKNLYNQVGTSFLTYRTNVHDSDLNATNEKSYAMGYESRATYTSQLSGSHHNTSDSRKYTWTLGYTDLFKNQPDLRRIKYVASESAPDKYSSLVAGAFDPLNGGGRQFSELYEHVYSFSHQFTQKIKIGSTFDFDVNVGNYLEYKSRFFNVRQFSYTLRAGSPSYEALLALPVDEIFAEPNLGGLYQYRLTEGTFDYDHYDASNRLIASFVSLNIPVTDRIKVVGGVRYENNVYKLAASVNQRLTEPEVTTNFLLPSVNATYNFSTKSLLRMAYGQTINRPEFRETAPIYYYDFDRRAGVYGALFQTSFSPNGDTLDVARIHNIDARYEWYPSAGEMVHAGVFYKHFKNPIQQVSYGQGDSRSFTIVNTETAYCYGLELDARKNLGFIDEKLGTRLFKSFSLVGNLALSKSEMDIDTSRVINTIPKSPLEGQSNYVVNLGAFYQNDSLALQASLLYNVFGSRLYAIGTTDNPSVGELPFQSLDLTMSKTFFKRYIVNIGVQNLLDQTVHFVIDTDENSKFSKTDKTYSSYKPGRYFSLGLKVKF